MLILIISSGVFLFFLLKGLCVVPEKEVWILERFGKFTRSLQAGLNWIVPFVEKIVDKHSLKEEAIEVPEQTAITQDNVSVILDGIVYIQVFDPVLASYGVKNPVLALLQLVQTTMRSEIGKLPLDKTFEERESINAKIVEAINEAAISWGIRCLRYEIKDIKMPEDIRKAMELQMTAERQKRARILESEGLRQSHINESEGKRQALINESEAAKIDRANRAKGEAEAIEAIAFASAKGIDLIAEALGKGRGSEAASLQVAEKYIKAFQELAKEGNTVLLPANLDSPSSMIAQALALYNNVQKTSPKSSLEKALTKQVEEKSLP